MPKGKKGGKAPKEKEVPQVPIETTLEEIVPTNSIYAEVKEDIKEPVIEVEDIDEKLPDTVDEFSVFEKAEEDKGEVWVKDHTLLKKVLGRKFTTSGTSYLGILK